MVQADRQTDRQTDRPQMTIQHDAEKMLYACWLTKTRIETFI